MHVVGHVLRNAGYAVVFAVTKEDAARFAQQEEIALAVLKAELADDYTTTISLARSAGSKANFIVCANPRDLKAIRAALDGTVGVSRLKSASDLSHMSPSYPWLCDGAVTFMR